MGERFVNVDRETPMLLPVDLRDWVPADDMVHFVLEVVDRVPESSFSVNQRRSGSPQYPPHMMTALLIYCYSQGVFSSRRIERATWHNITVRFLTGDTHPDHDTICAFRRGNRAAIKETFLQVTRLAREMGVLKIGTVSVDGTHIKANASKHKSIRYDRVRELEAKLNKDIEEMVEQAERNDAEDAADGDRLPKEIARRDALREKMREAQTRLEQRAQEREKQEAEERERKGKPPRGGDGASTGKPREDEQINLTDADSGLMRKSRRDGWTQSYNAQAMVDADGSQLVLAAHGTRTPSDANGLKAARDVAAENGMTVERMIADAGYVNAAAFEELEKDIDLYVAVTASDHGERQYDFRPVKQKEAKQTIRDPRLIAMQEKLRTENGKQIYRRRKSTVEPVFGIIKEVIGFRQFLLRGMQKVSLEWDLICTAYNVKRLWALKQG